MFSHNILLLYGLLSYLSFTEHPIFHKNWGRYNLYAKAVISNFCAYGFILIQSSKLCNRCYLKCYYTFL